MKWHAPILVVRAHSDGGVDNSMVVKGSRKECMVRRITGDQGERSCALDWGSGHRWGEARWVETRLGSRTEK